MGCRAGVIQRGSACVPLRTRGPSWAFDHKRGNGSRQRGIHCLRRSKKVIIKYILARGVYMGAAERFAELRSFDRMRRRQVWAGEDMRGTEHGCLYG